MANGNEDLTVGLLRAEIRAARAEDRNEILAALDERLKPVNEHVAAINRGELSPGLKAGIVAVVEEEKAGSWILRSNKAVVWGVGLALLSFITNVGIALTFGLTRG